MAQLKIKPNIIERIFRSGSNMQIEALHNEFITRLISSIVLILPVFLAIWLGGYTFLILELFCAVILIWEWTRLTAQGASKFASAVTYTVVLGFIFLASLHDKVVMGIAIISILLGVIGGLISFRNARRWLAGGIIYLALPLAALVWIRSDPEEGRVATFWLFSIVWATDISAYFIGRAVGGPKLLPRLSSKKTWAGLMGGAAAAAIVGGGFALFIETDSIVALVGLSAGLAIVAQAGDFFESWVKRYFNVKDSSFIIPGHGGLLDRVDGLLAVGAAVALLFALSEKGAAAWL